MSIPGQAGLSRNLEEISWEDYLKTWFHKNPEEWILRGQSCPQSQKINLKSRLEVALNSYDISLDKAPDIEKWMIRDFRRRYEGPDSETVSGDTLYCLSLMQHFGCPTRLLDFTYSPYTAAFFAVENMSVRRDSRREAYIFCFRHKWINGSARKSISDDPLFKKRFHDESITDESFKKLYMEKRRSFIVAEKPMLLHRRLSIQRGVFIIQGDITKSMMENIINMKDWQNKTNVILYKLKINNKEELKKVYEDLRLMDITHESLFPGLDGFSRSLKQNLYWYRDLEKINKKVYPFR